VSGSRVLENGTHGLKGGRWGGGRHSAGAAGPGPVCCEMPPPWPGRDLNRSSGKAEPAAYLTLSSLLVSRWISWSKDGVRH